MDMKVQIIQALGNSLVANNNVIQQATKLLKQVQQLPSYCMCLMEIIDSSSLDFNIRLAALVQLKNTIRNKWSHSKHQLQKEEKDAIKSALLTAIIRCSKDYRLLKIYKEILTNIVNEDYKEWSPLGAIIQKLRNLEDIEAILHCLIGISSAFQFSISPQERGYLFQFVKIILPELVQVAKNKQTPEIIYLMIKFLWKCVHYDITEEWMDLLKNVIIQYNPIFHKKDILQIQNRNTPQFYYFHTKKWAMKIFQRYIYKHMKLTGNKRDKKIIQLSNQWYKSYGNPLIQTVFQQFQYPTTQKIRYFQFKVFHSLLSQKPELLKVYAERLQYSVLIPYLQLQPEDQELANSEPLEFVMNQQEGVMNFKNLKKMATDLWIGISQIGAKISTPKRPYAAGIYLSANLEYLRTKLESKNLVEKQMGMYLICKLRYIILKTQMKEMIPNLILTYIAPQFNNEVMFLRARSVEIVYEYGMIELPLQTLKLITQAIYRCLTQDQHSLVRIKAAIAFNSVLKHSAAKQLVKPKLKQILTIYLQILDVYDLQLLVNSLESIVTEFKTEIGPYAQDLTKCLIKIFTKLFHRDFQQSSKEDYTGQMELAASGCLKAILIILDSPISEETLGKMLPDILSLFYFIFQKTGMDYIEDLLMILNTLMFKINKINQQLWFFYEVVIYYITGIPKQLWGSISQLPIHDQKKKVLQEIKEGGNIEMMEQTMPVLRNYIRKGSDRLLNYTDSFNINLLQLLFSLIDDMYKKSPMEYNGEIEMNCCTVLVIYFLQNNQQIPDLVVMRFWQLGKHNMTQKSTTLHQINIQLLALLFWVSKLKFIKFIQVEGMLEKIIKQFLTFGENLEEEHQRQRMILGLSELITIQQRSPQLLALFPQVYKLLVSLVKKNIDLRLEEEDEDHQVTQNNEMDEGDKQQEIQNIDSDDEDEDLQKLLNGDEEDDDGAEFWEEMYGENYSSNLDEIDQIKYFGAAMQKIQREESTFYLEMLKIIPLNQLKELGSRIQRAIQTYTQSANTAIKH